MFPVSRAPSACYLVIEMYVCYREPPNKGDATRNIAMNEDDGTENVKGDSGTIMEMEEDKTDEASIGDDGSRKSSVNDGSEHEMSSSSSDRDSDSEENSMNWEGYPWERVLSFAATSPKAAFESVKRVFRRILLITDEEEIEAVLKCLCNVPGRLFVNLDGHQMLRAYSLHITLKEIPFFTNERWHEPVLRDESAHEVLLIDHGNSENKHRMPSSSTPMSSN